MKRMIRLTDIRDNSRENSKNIIPSSPIRVMRLSHEDSLNNEPLITIEEFVSKYKKEFECAKQLSESDYVLEFENVKRYLNQHKDELSEVKEAKFRHSLTKIAQEIRRKYRGNENAICVNEDRSEYYNNVADSAIESRTVDYEFYRKVVDLTKERIKFFINLIETPKELKAFLLQLDMQEILCGSISKENEKRLIAVINGNCKKLIQYVIDNVI